MSVEDLLGRDFVIRCKNLKKTGNIFNPIFYIVFTRLVELSGIINEIFLPTPEEVEEMFKTRKDLLEVDLKTINETLRRAWKYEIERGVKYSFSEGIEDLMYVVHRMSEIQEKIDDYIRTNVKEWRKEVLIELYFDLLRSLLELEEKIQREVELENLLDSYVKLAKELGFNGEALERSFEVLREEVKPINHVKLEESGGKSKISEIVRKLSEEERKFVLSALKTIFGNS